MVTPPARAVIMPGMRSRSLFRFLAGLSLAAVQVLAADRVAGASSGKPPRRGDLVLFPFDDVAVPWRENLKLTLEAPRKYENNPVMKPGPEAGVDGYGSLLYGTVIKEGARFRMWYLAAPRLDSRIPGDVERNEWYRPVAYAESTDGIHWTRPDLGLVEFRGSRHNNLVSVEPAGEPYARAFDFVAVWLDPDDRPDRRYKMAYITHDPGRRVGSTATATSADALRWKLVNTGMFTRGHFESTGLIRFGGIYYLSGQNIPTFDAALPDGSNAGRVMKIFFSPDFVHWSSGRALAWYRDGYVPQKANFGQENHMGAGLWQRGNIVLGFYGRWYGDTIVPRPDSPLSSLKIDLGLVVSNDAIHYREPVRNFVMVHRGAPDDWDSEAILQANAFANTDTETLIWYSHWYTSEPDKLPALPAPLTAGNMQKPQAIGLLRMPRDRFGYFSKLLLAARSGNPPEKRPAEASCLSQPLNLDAPSLLTANVDRVSSGRALEIALVDDAERPLAGYTATLSESSLKAPVRWAGRQALPVRMPFRVKVTWPAGVDDGRLYAIYIEGQ
jgi:hypothetical protein